LNVLNCTIDLRTGKPRPHNRDDLITKLAPVEFDPHAETPLWTAVLARVMDGRDNLVGYLQRIAGLCLTGDASEQELYILFGGGANGKSVFIDTITGILGDYACEAASSLLTIGMHEQHPTEVADLCGRRLVVGSETEEGARFRVSLIKRLTGNARLKARYMRQDFFEFPRTHKLLIATNNRPSVRETSHAIWRRIRLIPFDVTIPDNEQDHRLLDKLRGEWPGILKWAIEGCLAWQRDGMQAPSEVLVATEEYQAEQDPLAEFFAAKCLVGPDLKASRTELFAGYQQWVKASGEQHPLERNAFYDHVRRVPGVSETMLRMNNKPTRVWTGIGIMDLSTEYQHATSSVTA
ncbi:MAG: DNA primase family protein, partial [Tepidisphaeraceae bacterium]